MVKKTFNNIKKNTKEIPVCANCLCTPKDSNMTEFMYFWVLNDCSIPHCELFCIECIEKGNKIIRKPYSKPRGRKKGGKNIKKND